ncbi:MAG TPA: LysR substrate-binding domain-containing protein [Opitutaceae bacterium]|nr:LysR substrate-binding domain-containing protein [Opitutaceae bacterium]
MELRHLRYFVAVAEELSYRKAADRLHVAQPALSTQIRDLESELGVRLLDRNTSGVRLTDAGAVFLGRTRLLLAQAQEAVAHAREAAKGTRGQLRVGYLAPLLVGFMPTSLKKFSEQYPEVDVTLVEMPIADQIAGLAAGEIQVGFTIKGLLPIPPGVQEIEVARSRIGVIMSRHHRLAKKSRIPLADVARETLLSLLVKKGWTVHGDLMRRSFAGRGIRHAPIKSVEGTETFRAMLESGLGISLVVEIGSLSRSRDLVFRPFVETGPDLEMELHALWREGNSSRIAANFVAMLRELIATLPAARQRKKEAAGIRR